MKLSLVPLLLAGTASASAAAIAERQVASTDSTSPSTASTATPTSTDSTPSSSSTTAVGPPSTVPTGVVIEGDYSGSLRPQIHFSPPSGWANDPNGMFRDSNGTWHFYYQYNPTGLVAGNQHWGHATSNDLYTWTNQPIALFPPNSTSGVFSGSAVVDANNTSGFFSNATAGVDNVVAIYTLNTPTNQVQELAYSYDGGYTFTPYEGNPVIDIGSTQFRDPKVFWHDETSSWVMAVAYSQDFTIGIYTSPNLKEWTHASNFTNHGLLGLQYECPNLVQVPVKDSDELAWVLYISNNPGMPQGGSAGQYFPGTFNGTHFEAVDGATRIAEFGKDDYARQWFGGTQPGESVSIAWASNWQYGQQAPTASEGWRSAMSLPRQHYLTNATRISPILVSYPYNFETVYNSSLLDGGAESVSVVNDSISVDFASLESKAVYFALNISLPANETLIPTTANLTVTFTSSGSSTNETLSMGYLFGQSDGGMTWIDRGHLGGFSNPFFTDKFSTAQAGKAYRIEGVLDRSLFELFLDEGAYAATVDVYPTSPLDGLTVETADLPEEAEVSLAVWGLRGTW
ncbi:hypothetical protein JCM8097_003607 [Rhodosporidiobolus ruineniae]